MEKTALEGLINSPSVLGKCPKGKGEGMGEESQGIKAMAHIEAMIDEAKIKIGFSKFGTEQVVFTSPDNKTIELNIESKKFRELISHRVWSDLKVLLKEWELKRITDSLKGRLLSQGVVFIEPDQQLDFLDKELFIALFIEFAQSHGRYEGRAEEMYKKLHKFAKDQGPAHAYLRQFPGGPNIMTKKIRKYKKVFESMGVNVELKRNNGCQIEIKCSPDGGDKQPSAQSSAANPANQGVSDSDGRNVDLEALKKRKKEGPRSLSGPKTI